MTFLEIAKNLGITDYPQEMDAIYDSVKDGAKPLFDRALIDRHHAQRELFGKYYEDVLRGYEDLLQHSDAYLYAQVAARYLQTTTHRQAKMIPVPEPDGSPALDMLPLMVELPMVDRGLAEFEKRGVSREQAEEYITSVFRGDIAVNIRRHGRPGLDKLYFDWITLYLYGLIFPCRGFKFNLTASGKFFYVLKHKKDGTVAVLLHGRDIHRSGKILGSAGLEDKDGAFHVEVTETDTGWTGHASNEYCLVERTPRFFSKTDWTLAVAPGDCVLAIHIPAGTALTPEVARMAIRDAFSHAEKYYADYAPKAVHCSSWLLNPELTDILGETSNIHAFAAMFHRYPVKCQGQGVFNFVFKTSVKPKPEDLPEDTRLQRALKAKYLAGSYLHNFAGYILPEDV